MADYSQYYDETQGTVFPCDPFDPEGAAADLRKAMKGFGTDEDTIIRVISRHTQQQLAEIELTYKQEYGKDLKRDLKSEIGGRFRDLVMARLEDHLTFDAIEVNRALKGLGTNENVLLEIFFTSDNEGLEELKDEYKKEFKKDLEKAVMEDTSGHFRRLLVSQLNAFRDEHGDVDEGLAQTEAIELFEAGVGKVGTDESTFNRIFCKRSYVQLQGTFYAYQSMYGRDIEEVIKKETSGALQKGLLTIVRIVRNVPAYFAERLYKSMKGIGSQDNDLIRLVVTRLEIDMEQVKHEFLRMYGKPLEKYIKGDTSGDYQKLLLAFCKETDPTVGIHTQKFTFGMTQCYEQDNAEVNYYKQSSHKSKGKTAKKKKKKKKKKASKGSEESEDEDDDSEEEGSEEEGSEEEGSGEDGSVQGEDGEEEEVEEEASGEEEAEPEEEEPEEEEPEEEPEEEEPEEEEPEEEPEEEEPEEEEEEEEDD